MTNLRTALHGDHIGSLLRPPELLEARQARREGRLSIEALHAAEDAAILKAFELQKQAGVEIFTDGEYRRNSFLDPITQGMEGLVKPDAPSGAATVWHGPTAALATDTMNAEVVDVFKVAGGKLTASGRTTGIEGAFMRDHAPGPWKMTMPGIMMRANAMFRPGITDRFYADVAAMVQDIVSIVQGEVRALIAEGCSYIQLDSLLYVNPLPPGMVERNIAVDNAIIDAAKAAGATVGLHMCRGNNRSAWLSEGTYEANAEAAFNGLHCDRFLLEYDTARSGGFEPLRFVPRDKTVVLGLISSKLPAVEAVDDVARRIEEASRYVDIDRLAVSPQCGFASSAPGNMLGWDDMRRKLELVSEVALKVWA